MEFIHPVTWLILFAVLLIIEAVTLGLTTIWFAGGAFIAFLVSLPFDNWIIEAIVFLVVSIVLLIFTRPIVLRYVSSKKTKTNYESLIGSIGKVSEQIDNINDKGTVTLNGLDWTARAENNDQIIEVGEKVEVKQISGVKLIVVSVKK